MTQRYLAWFGSLLAFGATAGMARAQPVDFVCPKAGVIEERGLGKIQYTGPSPSDPYVCNRINYKSEPEARLFNFYLLEDSSNAAVRTALTELFSGRKTSVKFDYTSPTRYLSHETWTFLRREQVNIGGKAIATVVYDRETMYETRTAFHGHFVQYLDPKNGLWVKNESNFISGQTNGQPPTYQDHSITLP